MPKLLQINVTSNWGATGKIAESIALAAQKKGWECYTAYGRMLNPSKTHLIKVGNKIDTYIHYVYDRFFDMEGCASVASTKRLIKQIDQLNPDIVHLHNIHDHFLNYKILFGYLNHTDIKVVWTFHDCWAFTGHCYHFVEYNCDKWKTCCNVCPDRHKLCDRSKENFFLKKSLFLECKNLTIVPCSHWLSNIVKESFLKDKRIEVIHNGVDLNIFRPLKNTKNRNNNVFRIIAVSNVWKAYKGLYDIFKLREILPSEYEITMVGLKKEQLKDLPNGIRGITRTDNVQQLIELYNDSDVLINPTYADTFPTVNLESLACGTPVITYNTGGSPEAVSQQTGVVVEQGDINGLANSIVQMRDNPLSSENCRARAIDFFDKEKCFNRYVLLYESLCSE